MNEDTRPAHECSRERDSMKTKLTLGEVDRLDGMLVMRRAHIL